MIFVKQPQVRPLVLVGGLGGLIVGVFLLGIFADVLQFLIYRIGNVASMEGRAAAWATAVAMVVDSPLTGMGFYSSAYFDHKPEFYTSIGLIPSYLATFHGVPHNEYLHVAVLLGVPGLILFLMILFGIVRTAFRVFENPDEPPLRRHLGLYSGAIVIALMLNSVFSDTFLQDYFWLLAFFLVGIAAGRLESASREVPHARPVDWPRQVDA